MTNNLQKLTDEKIKEFEEKFKCIQNDCVGGGYTSDEGQCQFCAKYLFPIKSFISQTIQDIARATADVIKLDELQEKANRIKLEMNAVLCDCSEPYEDSGLEVYLVPELLSAISSMKAKKKEWFNK